MVENKLFKYSNSGQTYFIKAPNLHTAEIRARRKMIQLFGKYDITDMKEVKYCRPLLPKRLLYESEAKTEADRKTAIE